MSEVISRVSMYLDVRTLHWFFFIFIQYDTLDTIQYICNDTYMICAISKLTEFYDCVDIKLIITSNFRFVNLCIPYNLWQIIEAICIKMGPRETICMQDIRVTVNGN